MRSNTREVRDSPANEQYGKHQCDYKAMDTKTLLCSPLQCMSSLPPGESHLSVFTSPRSHNSSGRHCEQGESLRPEICPHRDSGQRSTLVVIRPCIILLSGHAITNTTAVLQKRPLQSSQSWTKTPFPDKPQVTQPRTHPFTGHTHTSLPK